MADLETQLKAAQNCRFKMIVTDGVFSMDGFVAPLDKICDLADKYNALVMVDESHASGFIGKTGRGTVELKNVMHRVDLITGTLGKALGGAMGGFTSGKKEIIEKCKNIINLIWIVTTASCNNCSVLSSYRRIDFGIRICESEYNRIDRHLLNIIFS